MHEDSIPGPSGPPHSERSGSLDECPGGGEPDLFFQETVVGGGLPTRGEALAAGADDGEGNRWQQGIGSPPASPGFGGGRFSQVRRIGAGGMGEVFEVIDEDRGSRVALKTLPKASPQALYLFKQEFRSLAELSHPNLVPLYELISDGDEWFFTMELVDGVDFLRHVRPKDSQAPDLAVLRGSLAQLTHGIHALHEARKLHRDIKPSNVLVNREGRVLLLDFGLVAEIEAPEGAGAASVGTGERRSLSGTIAYMAPEQAAGQILGRASDWYAMGAMLYHALTGRYPHTGSTAEILFRKQRDDPTPPRGVAPDTPPDLDDLCTRLLQRDPAARPGAREILGILNEAEPPPAVGGLPESLPFLGREKPLEELAAAYRAVQAGATRIVNVFGRSGAGKSTLVRHFTDRLADAVVLAGKCYEQESVPFKALDSLIDALGRHLDRLPEPERRALVPADLNVLARIFPVLHRMPSGVSPTPDIPDLREMRRRAFEALRELLRRIGARHPLVLCLDDLQWGDLDSAALLAHVMAAPDPPPLLLLIGYRSEYVDRSPCLQALAAGLPGVDLQLEVGPLSPGSTERLVQDLLGEAAPDRDRVERIARESRGIPYFVLELARHTLRVTDPADATAGSEEIDLDEVLWNRVQRLPAEARCLLEVIAVAGQPLALRDASDSARLGVIEERLVKVLRTEHFVRGTGPGLDDEVEPFHDCIRESVVAHLAPPTLVAHHLGLAESFVRRRSADPETIAVHFEAAEHPLEAGEYFAEAADQAGEALAFERAVTLYRKALLLRPVTGEARMQLERKLGDSLHHANRAHEAAQSYESASRHASGEALVDLKRRAAELYCVSGHLDEGIELFRDLMRDLGLPYYANPARALLSILRLRALLKFRGLRFRERPVEEVPRENLVKIDVLSSASIGISMVQSFVGSELQTRSTLLALRAGEPFRLAKSFAWEAGYSTVKGVRGAAQSQALLDAASDLAAKVDNPVASGLAVMSRAMVAYHQLRLADTIRHGLEAEEILRDRCKGVVWELNTTRIFILWAMAFSGRLRELRERSLLYQRMAREQDDLLLETNLGSYVLPLLHLLEDDVSAAQEGLTEAMAKWERATRSYKGFHVQHLTQLQAQSYIHFCTGDGAAARAFANRMWPSLKRSLILSWESQGVLLRHFRAACALEAARVARKPKPLVQEARADLRRIQRLRVPWAEPFSDHLLAAVAAAEGRPEEAVARLERAERGMAIHDFALMAPALRYRRGTLIAGEEGRALQRSAEDEIAAAGVVNPARVVAMYAPGF